MLRATVQKFIVDIAGKLPTIIGEYSDPNSFTNSYVYADAQILVQYAHSPDPNVADGKYYYVHDRLGSVRMVVDCNTVAETVSAKNTYTYSPFGNPYAGELSETVYNPFQFTGQWLDVEIDQYYLRARMYDPTMMRFTTRDPVRGKLQKPLSLHKYLYCQNDGVNHIDPSGEILGMADLLVTGGMSAHLRKMDYKFHMKLKEQAQGQLDSFSIMNLQRGVVYDLMVADVDGSFKKSIRDGGIEALGLFSENLGRFASISTELRDDRKAIRGILESEQWGGLFDYGKDKLTDIFTDPDTYGL